MNKKLEITYARAIFCIAIVALHSFPGLITDPNTSDFSKNLNSFIRVFLLFATPSFIILSEILLSLRYSNGLPKGFFFKRIKFILLPYLFIGVFYSLNIYLSTDKTRNFLDIFITYILYGSWYGWFVIVIFQFYILHAIFHNFLNKRNPIIILLITFIISFSHSFTTYFNQDYLQWWAEFYPVYSRAAIPYWIFYFVFGYYLGKNYEYVMKMLQKYIWIVVALWVCSIIPITMFYHYKGVVYAQSNRFDIMLYTILTFLIILYTMKVLSRYKFSVLLLISEISFFIYLSHPLINEYISRGLAPFVNIPIVFIVVLTVFTLGLSIGIAILLAQLPFSKYLIGRNSFKKMLYINYVNDKDN